MAVKARLQQPCSSTDTAPVFTRRWQLCRHRRDPALSGHSSPKPRRAAPRPISSAAGSNAPSCSGTPATGPRRRRSRSAGRSGRGRDRCGWQDRAPVRAAGIAGSARATARVRAGTAGSGCVPTDWRRGRGPRARAVIPAWRSSGQPPGATGPTRARASRGRSAGRWPAVRCRAGTSIPPRNPPRGRNVRG